MVFFFFFLLTSVDAVKGLPQAVEVEEVDQQLLKLLLLHPIIAIAAALLRDGPLVRTHQRRLVVQQREPLDNPAKSRGAEKWSAVSLSLPSQKHH